MHSKQNTWSQLLIFPRTTGFSKQMTHSVSPSAETGAVAWPLADGELFVALLALLFDEDIRCSRVKRSSAPGVDGDG
jgi:hypothetical protein